MKQSANSVKIRTFCATISIIFAALCATSASAQSADKIVKQAVKAMTNGKGEKALREIRSWQVKGTITSLKDDSSGGYRAAAAHPSVLRRPRELRNLARCYRGVDLRCLITRQMSVRTGAYAL